MHQLKSLVLFLVIGLSGTSSLLHAQKHVADYSIIWQPRTFIYSISQGKYLAASSEYKIRFHNTSEHTWKNIELRLVLSPDSYLELANPNDSLIRRIDSIPPTTWDNRPEISWPVRFTAPMAMDTVEETKIVMVASFAPPYTQRDTAIQDEHIQILSSALSGVTVELMTPESLMFVAEDSGYVPEAFQTALKFRNISNSTFQNIQVDLKCSQPEYIAPANPGDSLDRWREELWADKGFSDHWDLTYTDTIPKNDSIDVWVHVKAYNKLTRDSIAFDSNINTIRIYDFPIPDQYDISSSITIPDLPVRTCSGYDYEIVPIRFRFQNRSWYNLPVQSIKINPPDDWQFIGGDTQMVAIGTPLRPSQEIDLTWHAVPPSYLYSKTHQFSFEVTLSDWYTLTFEGSCRSMPDAPVLKYVADGGTIHLKYNTESGMYEPSPVALGGVAKAWSGDFEPVTYNAELINGLWMYLELDESKPGMEITKHLPAFQQCDSVALHWQAKVIKLNETQTPFIGAIKYTVYRADSSIYNEYIQQIIIDPVNVNGISRPPTADELTLSAYPNPFAGRTTIEYTLDAWGPISLTIVDLLGREVAELKSDFEGPGTHSVSYTHNEDISGFYLIILTSQSGVTTKPLYIVR